MVAADFGCGAAVGFLLLCIFVHIFGFWRGGLGFGVAFVSVFFKVGPVFGGAVGVEGHI